MRNWRIIAIVAAVSLGAACTDVAAPEEIDSASAVQAEEVSFLTRGGTDVFEEGDQVGLYALEPINAYDITLTLTGSALVPSTPVYWAKRQSTATTFVACYPGGVGFVPTRESYFRVALDQSGDRAFHRSDLMGAVTTAAPSDGAVSFNFKHMLCRIQLTIDPGKSGKVPVTVLVSNVPVGAYVDIFGGAVRNTEDFGEIKAHKSADNLWEFIMAPGTTGPIITVTMEDGSIAEFDPEIDNTRFRFGGVHTATLTLR